MRGRCSEGQQGSRKTKRTTTAATHEKETELRDNRKGKQASTGGGRWETQVVTKTHEKAREKAGRGAVDVASTPICTIPTPISISHAPPTPHPVPHLMRAPPCTFIRPAVCDKRHLRCPRAPAPLLLATPVPSPATSPASPSLEVQSPTDRRKHANTHTHAQTHRCADTLA